MDRSNNVNFANNRSLNSSRVASPPQDYVNVDQNGQPIFQDARNAARSPNDRYLNPVDNVDPPISVRDNDEFFRAPNGQFQNWGRTLSPRQNQIDNQEYFEAQPNTFRNQNNQNNNDDDDDDDDDRNNNNNNNNVNSGSSDASSDGKKKKKRGKRKKRPSKEDTASTVDGSAAIRMRKQDLYFQTQIRNSGFWGKVKLRNGTLLFMGGILQLCISVVMIGVFWRWWWGPTVNIINRVIAITLLVTGTTCVVCGMVSNYLMNRNRFFKNVLGSPLRRSSIIFIGSICSIFIASILMAIYYTYWHNRFVNTPIISVSMACYFFGTIALLVSLRMSCTEYELIRYSRKRQKEKRGVGDDIEEITVIENEINNVDSDEYENEESEMPTQATRALALNQPQSNEANEYDANHSFSQASASETGRRDFRKKGIQLKPRFG